MHKKGFTLHLHHTIAYKSASYKTQPKNKGSPSLHLGFTCQKKTAIDKNNHCSNHIILNELL